MKGLILFLSICLKMCSCWNFAQRDDKFHYETSITKDPYMVMLVHNYHDIVSYGALIHERAVLTTAAIGQNEIFQMQVFADCHALGDQQEIDHRICKNVKNITESNILEEFPASDNPFNLVVLILSSPFKLTPTLNVIHVGNKNDVELDLCKIMNPTLVRNPITNEIGTLFYPTYNVDFVRQKVNLLSYFDNVKYNEKLRVPPGSPLLCKSKTDANEWYAIAIVIELNRMKLRYFGTSPSVSNSDHRRLAIFLEILNKFKIPGS